MTTPPDYWPAYDSVQYDTAAEVAISLIGSAGFGYAASLDNAGQPVSEDLQTALMDVMFRSDGLADIFRAVATLTEGVIVLYNNTRNNSNNLGLS
jgi:hypothetical protein